MSTGTMMTIFDNSDSDDNDDNDNNDMITMIMITITMITMTIITIMTMINMTMMIIYNNHDQDDQHGFIDTGMNWLMEKFQLYIPDVWHFSVNKMNKFSNRILSRVCHHNGCFALFHEQK